MTKTCSQCGAVLPSDLRVCHFCDSSFSVGSSAQEELADNLTRESLALQSESIVETGDSASSPVSANETTLEAAWRGELAQRLKAYRTRRRKHAANEDQSRFSFEEISPREPADSAVAIEEPPAPMEEDFAFTIAIGRASSKKTLEKSTMEIDVSLQPDAEIRQEIAPGQTTAQAGLYPVASIDDRRIAAVIDLVCLLFAYGGFLGLFGSLGGQFTLSKLSAAVCAATFAAVYLQYFALFTIFGGTTPGMMMRGLQVVSFTGDAPTPRQMLLRSAGYVLSAGTFFLGFLWAMWDEDELTWHDRLSRTYLSAEQTMEEIEAPGAAHSR
ncbi:MAG TPA: RDD family protein [Candidatus Angelobacter sp.]|nr:RDD family protein [Candidatus Angelobacter sp.]